MKTNIIVFDIETQHTFDEVGGRDNLNKLGISVLGAFDYLKDDFCIFDEQELPIFFERLQKTPLLVGFNSRRFDTPILQQYAPFDLRRLPQLDIMEEVQKVLGHRLGLDTIAQATLGTGKSGDGLDAIRYFREGRMQELKKYCLDDVRITRDIYEYGASKSELFYLSKFSREKARVPVSWKRESPKSPADGGIQQSLFSSMLTP